MFSFTLCTRFVVVPSYRPFSKMAADNSNKLKLAKIKNVYQHQKEHLQFSNPAKFKHFRCNIMRVPFSFSFSYYILKTKLELPFSLFVFPLLRATELRFSLCFSSSVSVGHQKTEFGLRFSFLVFLFYFVISRQQPVKLTRALWVCVYFYFPYDPRNGRHSCNFIIWNLVVLYLCLNLYL